MNQNGDQSAVMASQICDQIRSVFASPSPSPALQLLLAKILPVASSPSGKIFVHGVGREGLMLKALCMRLYHLGLSAHVVGDVTTPPIAAGDLLIASAGPGRFSTVDAICGVAKSAGAQILLLTARPGYRSQASLAADAIACIPAQTMADDDEEGVSAGGTDDVRLPLGSLYEGAMFVLFEMVVLRLAEELGRTPAMLRSRHTNLE